MDYNTMASLHCIDVIKGELHWKNENFTCILFEWSLRNKNECKKPHVKSFSRSRDIDIFVFSIVTSFWARSQKRHIWNDVRLRRFVHHFLTECSNYLIIWTFKDQDHYFWNLKLKMYFFKFWHYYDVITGTDVKFLKMRKTENSGISLYQNMMEIGLHTNYQVGNSFILRIIDIDTNLINYS